MIVPSIGRKVWYFPSDQDLAEGLQQHDPNQAWDATVVYVWSPTCVNLAIRDHNGTLFTRTSVAINVEGASPHAEWMPYQIGQAKKHEEESKS